MLSQTPLYRPPPLGNPLSVILARIQFALGASELLNPSLSVGDLLVPFYQYLDKCLSYA